MTEVCVTITRPATDAELVVSRPRIATVARVTKSRNVSAALLIHEIT